MLTLEREGMEVITQLAPTILSLHPLQPLIRSFSWFLTSTWTSSTTSWLGSSLSSIDTADMLTEGMSGVALLTELVF